MYGLNARSDHGTQDERGISQFGEQIQSCDHKRKICNQQDWRHLVVEVQHCHFEVGLPEVM